MRMCVHVFVYLCMNVCVRKCVNNKINADLSFRVFIPHSSAPATDA